jgi:hypothetical protein
MQKLTKKEERVVTRAELKEMKRFASVTMQADGEYHCWSCNEKLKAWYSIATGWSIGLICPSCGRLYSFQGI